MDDDIPDVPLTNFGPTTDVATPPVASEPSTEEASEQTTPSTEASGSEEPETPSQEPQKTEDNPIAEEEKSGRPSKQERLNGRFGELTAKVRERDVQLEQLQAQIAQMQATGQVTPLQPDENGQFSVEDIQRNQAQLAEASARAQVSQLESRIEREAIANRYDLEGTKIETKYAEDFKANPTHLENIQDMIAEAVELNRNNQQALKQISPLKIAERYMKGVESERRIAQSSSAQNLQTIKAESAEVPQNAVTSNADDNSIDGLEARLADVKF